MADGKVVISTELETKQFDKQIAKLESDLKVYQKALESDAKIPVSVRMSADERKNLEITIEKTKNQLISLREQAQRTGEVGKDAGEKSGKGFEKGLSSLKRFGMALLGVRGAFTLVRKATSSYLNEHEETANKINSIWVALGNALAPIIEFIANAVLKLIGYLNVFLQALGFDIDLTKNMGKSSKAIDNTTKSMKELNRQVASFDEMSVAQKETSTGGVGGGGTSGTGAFQMPELNENIVNFLKDTAKFLKENWRWLVLIGTVIAGYKVANWLSSLGKLGGALSTLAQIGIIAVGVDLLYDAVTGRNLIEDLKTIAEWLPKLNTLHKNNTKTVKENNKETQSWIKTKNQDLDAMEKGSQEASDYYYKLRDLVTGITLNNKAMIQHTDQIGGLGYVVNQITGETREYTQRLQDNNLTMQGVIQEMANMYKQGLLTADQEKEFKEILKATNGVLEDGKVKFEQMDNSIWVASQHTENYEDILKATKNTAKTTFENMKESAKQFVNDVARLKATPEIKFKTDISDLKNKLQSLSSIPLLNFGGTITNALNKIKSLGLAKGGIVNNPGRGVPIANVITGEATNGAEGVVPLNNEQSMELIGQAVAKHVVINLTNNTMLDGKVIAREQRKISDENNFLTNGRGV